jgi:hypothetical protein
MVFKKCQRCGKRNPSFFTRCLHCDTPLVGEPIDDEKKPNYLKFGVVIFVSVVLVIFVIIPGVQYSWIFLHNFSDAISGKSGAGSQIIVEYPKNRPAQYNDLRVAVLSARDGQNTYNSNKFFIVSVQMQNSKTRENIQIYSSDFELIDSEGSKYFPYGIGSQMIHDLSPQQGISTTLLFVIPQKSTAKNIQFTFPGPSSLTSNRNVVRFVL